MMVGILLEIIGYISRCLSVQVDPYLVIHFVIQYFFIVVAPVFFAAAIYTVLSKVINATGREYAPLEPRIILWIFMTCDAIATGVQIAGAAMIGSAESNRKDPTTPNNILLGGLAFQAFTFLIFILFGMFAMHARCVMFTVVSKSFYVAFTLAVLLFYIRFLFRLAETTDGLFGYLNKHEVFFGALEFMPVVVAIWLLAVWHPGQCIPRTRAGSRANVERK